ncbi:MAG: glycosyltransferase family 39 protein [Syntrophobacterales bacterium]|jgi:4-amino-4-deoxy-L-arabinose transferase-like glycosyltransferase|nr:glycosyltransferase family 39 protein [Syntrophobacterales bacterium]
MDDPVKRRFPLVLPIAIILALAAFLLLFHLDQRPFWQDEAETACLARNVLKYGVPRAYDGVNFISQEQGQEFDQNYLWRWSPWLQIYATAGAFRIMGPTTFAGRLPFTLFGLACIFLVYRIVSKNFGNHTWGSLAALLLCFSVVFLLSARQARYYSMGAFLTLLSLHAFMEDWQSRLWPALLLCLSVGLLFYTNYLLFISFLAPALLAAIWLYSDKIPLKRTAKVIFATAFIILPGLFLFRIQEQSKIIHPVLIPVNLENYFSGLFQFMLPLPIIFYLVWRWRRILWTRSSLPQDPAERFTLFLTVIVMGNIIFLSPVPQCEHRYLLHLYPLCAIILGWVILQAWRFQKFSAILLGFLLLFTNWLNLIPMDWLYITNRPLLSDRHMLTYPNFPLKLFLTELRFSYPDVIGNLIGFFKTHAQPGETILITYGDLPLQFYTNNRVIGGLQGNIAIPSSPDWVVPRWETRWNRVYHLNYSEIISRAKLSSNSEYYPLVLSFEDEAFGNIPDPYEHRFIPLAQSRHKMVVYKKRSVSSDGP